MPNSNRHSQKGMDFKSIVSTSFTNRPQKLMSKPFTKYDFITDLDYGKASEKTIAGILGLSAKEFEVKTERDWWTRTGNIAIELEYKGKASGLNITEAPYWIHVLQEKDEPFCFVIIPVKKFKNLIE